ncbi:MAG: DNA polymerase III subunit gamma/tau [Candidatus Marinimicrobia bacterium]|nr:DNA polymerase III subunit gamma/tau [Candidatus Neomarinimicrobiota bacterium]
MSYQVLSRKWRPQVFEELIGQAHVVKTLQNALKRGRVAHAYIFTGPRGVGKTTTARILAKALNCPNSDGMNPCNRCQVCAEITRGGNLDVLEIDGASNRRIDEIRELREAAKYPPSGGKHRIYIIDEVHMLTIPAFNALLKTLEEPPPQLVFILATTDPQKVPQTILSRTQRFDFRRVPAADIATLLMKILDDEKISYDENALVLLARKAEGSVRDSLSLLDQVIAYESGKIDEAAVVAVLGLVEDAFFAGLLDSIGRHDAQAVLSKVAELFDGGYDLKEVAQGFNQFLRDGILQLETGDPRLASKGVPVALPEGMETADLLGMLDIGLETEAKLRYAQQPRILMEHQFLKMTALDRVVSIREVLEGLGGLPPGQEAAVPPTGSKRTGQSSPAEREPSTGAQPQSNPPEASIKRSFSRQGSQVAGAAGAQRRTSETGDDAEAIPPDGLAQLRELWKQIVDEVATRSQGTAATLEGSELASLEGRNLTVNLPASKALQLKILMDKRELVESIVQAHSGWKIRLLPIIPETRPQEAHSKEASSRDQAMLDELIDTFKGEEY